MENAPSLQEPFITMPASMFADFILLVVFAIIIILVILAYDAIFPDVKKKKRK